MVYFVQEAQVCQGNYRNPTNIDCQKILYKIESVWKITTISELYLKAFLYIAVLLITKLFLVQILDDLNRYDILEPCFHTGKVRHDTNENTTLNIPESFHKLGAKNERPLAVRKRMFGRAWPFRAPVEDGIIPLWPQLMREVKVPCMVSRVKSEHVRFVSFVFLENYINYHNHLKESLQFVILLIVGGEYELLSGAG